MSRPLRALIHTEALKHNLHRVRELAPKANVMAVIKANAYGHGVVTAAHALNGADAFAVASMEEALELQDGIGIHVPIVLLEGLFRQDDLGIAAGHALVLVVQQEEQIAALEAYTGSQPLRVWLKINTGMNRLGLAPEEAAGAWERLGKLPHVSRQGVMSHLACADEPEHPATPVQMERFGDCTGNLDTVRSLANSAGIAAWPDSHYDWVRPGIMLYGSSPVIGKTAEALDLKPAMTLASELIAVRTLNKGDSVGYGATWQAPKEMRVGVVACGYADGYPRHAPTGTPVLVNGERCQLVGRVSMDMITVDLSTQPKAAIGDPVVLWGQGLPVDEIAGHADTISYELLCQVTRRVPRVIEPLVG